MRLKNNYLLILFVSIITFISCSSTKDELELVDVMLNDTSNFFYTDLDVYKKKNPNLPIGIFDSGTGGLTVFDAIVNFDKYNNNTHRYSINGDSIKDFNNESFIYLADQANMPYGNYGAHNKELLLKEHVLKDVQFLLGNKYYNSGDDKTFQKNKSPIKALVIACNTATAFGKDEIEKFVTKANIDLKVIGVIGAGVRAALENIPIYENVGIAIMATAGTVSSNGYVNEINTQLNTRNNTGNISIFQQAGIGLAGAIDESIEFIDRSANAPRAQYKGPSDINKNLFIDTKLLSRYNFDWSKNHMLYNGSIEDPKNIQINSVDNYIAYHVTTLLEKVKDENNSSKLSKIILGCTHYPFFIELFKNKIEQLRNYQEDSIFVYKKYLADKVDFIDPSIFTAKELYDYLSEESLFNNDNISNSEFYISVPNRSNKDVIINESGNFVYDYKYGREENNIQEYVKRVPFNKENINKEVAERLSLTIPYTYNLIRNFNWNNKKTSYLKENERLD